MPIQQYHQKTKRLKQLLLNMIENNQRESFETKKKDHYQKLRKDQTYPLNPLHSILDKKKHTTKVDLTKKHKEQSFASLTKLTPLYYCNLKTHNPDKNLIPTLIQNLNLSRHLNMDYYIEQS